MIDTSTDDQPAAKGSRIWPRRLVRFRSPRLLCHWARLVTTTNSKGHLMSADYSAIFAIIALLGATARALVSVMRHRRAPAPAAEQLLEGLAWGFMIAVALIAVGARVTA